MSRRIIAPVSVVALKWARETAGYPTLEEAMAAFSKTAKRTFSCLPEWENGESKPSVSQAKQLAKFYHRPITDLYLREIPDEMKDPEPPDFRRSDSPGTFSPNLRLLIRQANERQKWAREFLLESPESNSFSPPVDFSGRPDAEILGEKIRKWLKIDSNKLAQPQAPKDALEYWIRCAEAQGIIVMQSHRHSAYQVNTNEFSGCALADDVAPLVVLNSGDSDLRRIFTLAHELAHLWVGAPGISHVSFRADALYDKNDEDDEAYCNRAAAAALMPEVLFRQEWQDATGNEEEKVDYIAKHFMVSHSAAAVRATRMQFIPQEHCDELLAKYAKKFAEEQNAKKNQGGRAYPDTQALKRVGDYFARLTLDAYEQGAISALDVGHLFDVKLDYLSKIATRLEFPLHRWAQ